MSDLVSFESFKEFWKQDPIVVIDSSSLLDLYRYAPNASRNILKNFKKIEGNIWLPAQVLEEYFNNKVTVISEAHKKFENVSKEIENIVKKAEKDMTSKFHRYGKFKYPNVTTFRIEIEEIISKLNDKAKSFKELVKVEIQDNKEVLQEDEVNSFIDRLKELSQIGMPFSLSQKIEIYREGEFRYKHLIPPGYKDITKDKKDPTKTEKYGDLIIWKELLNKSRKVHNPFIFVTDDEKEDWWELKVSNTHLGEKKEIIGPRKELISEFEAISNIGKDGFLMLTLPQFNKHISKINEVNTKELFLNDIELNPEEIVKEIVDPQKWDSILDESGKLTSFFIHDGELQDLTGEILTDVEIQDILKPVFDNLYVDYYENDVFIEGSFNCEVLVNILTALSSAYSEWIEAKVLLSGNITIEFSLGYDETRDIIERVGETISVTGITIDNYEKLTIESDYSHIACISCNVRPGEYFTKESEPVCGQCLHNFEVCTGCGYLYEYGTLGGYKCVECGNN